MAQGDASILLDDGSWLVLIGLPSQQLQAAPGPGMLSLQDFVTSAVIGGVAGNLTYDVLKRVGERLAERLGISSSLDVDAIADLIVLFLLSNGYASARITSILEVSDRGWHVEGVVDGSQFSGRADRSGRVVHIQIAT